MHFLKLFFKIKSLRVEAIGRVPICNDQNHVAHLVTSSILKPTLKALHCKWSIGGGAGQ